MTFVHPVAWALAALLAVPIILYLLPMPRRRTEQPSLMLWKKMLKERPASQSWHWLRTVLSFVLEAAILVFLILAVGSPVFNPAEGAGQTAVIVLDVSASMKAPISSGARETRFDRARGIAGQIVGAMPSGRRAALLAAGTEPTVVAGLTDQRAIILQRLDALACTDGRTDMAAAVKAAAALATGEGNADIYILSDGQAPVSDVALAGARVHYLRVGETLPNIGVVAFSARRVFDAPEEFEALARVQNTYTEEKSVKLTLAMDDNATETRTLKLAAGSTSTLNFTGKVRGKGVLKVSLDTGDAFPADDSACVLLGTSQKTSVVLVSDSSDRFIESALTANLAIDSFVATLAQYMDKRPQPDVLILDGVLPPELPPGNLLIVNPPNATSIFRVAGDVQNPQITSWTREHPVLADITLKDVVIPSARALKPTAPVEVLVDAGGTPLMFALQSGDRRIVVLAFDPGDSSLSFRIAFPVLVSNAFAWLTHQGDVSATEVAAGSDVRLKPAAPMKSLIVDCPRGIRKTLAPVAGEFVLSAADVGLYQVNMGARGLTVAANLTDPNESDLTVQPEMKFADASVPGRESRAGGMGEFWLVAAMIAAALLAAEWYLYHHRWTV